MPEHIKIKVAAVVKYLPACLFFLYSLLIFFFCLAPAVTFPGAVIGSAYNLLNNTPFQGVISAVIAFASLSVFSALIGIVLLETPFFDLARAAKGNIVKILRFVWKFVPCLFYFVFFILVCVMFGKVADLNHSLTHALGSVSGAPQYSPGVCPVLILVFTLIFAIAQAAALIVEFKVLNHVKLIPADEE